MKSKINEVNSFEVDFKTALRSTGHLFPTTDSEMDYFMDHAPKVDISAKYRTPDFLFSDNLRPIVHFPELMPENSPSVANWAMAARNGKAIPHNILEKMKKDKEESQK